MPRVVVMGGSVGGLTTALVLRDAGCDVRVFERSPAALTTRGAGIAVLDSTLRYLTERGGLRAEDVCSSTGWIRFLHRDGSVRASVISDAVAVCCMIHEGTRAVAGPSGCGCARWCPRSGALGLPNSTGALSGVDRTALLLSSGTVGLSQLDDLWDMP